MPYTPYSFTIEPRGSETIVCTLRRNDRSGVVVRPYKNGTVEAADTFSVTARQQYTVVDDGDYALSMKIDGVERATSSGGYRFFSLNQAGANPVFTPLAVGALTERDRPGWRPTDVNGLLAETIPAYLAQVGSNSQPVDGTVYAPGLWLPPCILTGVSFVLAVSGTTVTHAFFGVADASRALLGVSADSAAVVNAAAAWKEIDFASAVTLSTPGVYRFPFFCNGGTMPNFARGSTGFGNNRGATGAAAQFVTSSTGQTTAIANPLGAYSVNSIAWYLAVRGVLL